MSNHRRGRQLHIEKCTLPVDDLPSTASSSKDPRRVLIGGDSRNYCWPRKWPQCDEPHHVSTSRDKNAQICVISIKEDCWKVVDVVFIDDLDENWVSKAVVEQFELEATYSKVTTWGHHENLTVKFIGTAKLQWSQKDGYNCYCSQFTTCRVVDSEAFNVFLKMSLLPKLDIQSLAAQDSPSNQKLLDERTVPNLPEFSPYQAPLPESSPELTSVNVPSPNYLSIPTKVGAFDSADSADFKYGDDCTEANSADLWMEQFRKSVHHRIEMDDRGHAPVKIAILDTGIDLKHNFIQGAIMEKRIQARKSFVDNGVDVQDLCGHGTHVAGLVLKAAPEALIYIAKISRDMEVLSSHKIAEAIKWAVDQGTDIISLSFGLDDNDEHMQNQISEAFRRNVLIFAAAANHGGNKRVSYPARNDHVICVYASDGSGKPFDGNPTALEDSVYRFATLGMAVDSYWPRDENQDAGITPEQQGRRRMTGTSCAVPITAAIAACILEFAHINSLQRELFSILKTRQGMQKVLKGLMVAPKPHQGFHYICPWEMFDKKSDQEIIFSMKECLRRT